MINLDSIKLIHVILYPSAYKEANKLLSEIWVTFVNSVKHSKVFC